MDRDSTGSGSAFVDAVRALQGGALAAQLDAAICELVAAVQATEAKGSIVLAITIKPFAKRNATTLVVDGGFKVKVPEVPHGGDVFFATADHALTRHDPRQPELEGLREPRSVVSMPARAVGAHLGAARE